MRGRGRSIYNTPGTSVAPVIQKIPVKTVKKKKNNPKGKFIIHSNHDNIKESINLNAEYYQVISIDPGLDNYAFRIERRYNSLFGPYHISIITVAMTKEIFTEERRKIANQGTKSILYRDIVAFLDTYERYYNDCVIVIIEGQMAINYPMVRVSQCTIDYFLNRYPEMIVIELDSHQKGDILGAPDGVTGKKLKDWGVETAKNLFINRNDIIGMDILNNNKDKDDDLADTVLGIEALFKLLGLK
jgi:hypothetical protein